MNDSLDTHTTISRPVALATLVSLATAMMLPRRASAAGATTLGPIFAARGPWLGGRETATEVAGKVVVVDVFTVDCFNCRNVTPTLRALHRRPNVIVIAFTRRRRHTSESGRTSLTSSRNSVSRGRLSSTMINGSGMLSASKRGRRRSSSIAMARCAIPSWAILRTATCSQRSQRSPCNRASRSNLIGEHEGVAVLLDPAGSDQPSELERDGLARASDCRGDFTVRHDDVHDGSAWDAPTVVV